MSISAVPWDVFYLEPYSETKSLEKLLADENFSAELADQINQNFVLEVEASHKIREEVETDLH